MKSIGVAFITHNAQHHFPQCVRHLFKSPLRPRIVIVNSSSQDGTIEIAQDLGLETLIIPREEFNHGTTREKARHYLGTDIVVMMTPDAYAKDVSMLEHLVAPIQKGIASVSYARQIPHEGANFFESFPRNFNYPEESHVRGIQDSDQWGAYTYFCSDSCAAWCNRALDSIGGFQSVLLGEDTIAVAKLLKEGHQIAYTAEAVVHHSHRYSLLDELRRHFDTGLARAQYREFIAPKSSDHQRGVQYVQHMLEYLAKEAPRQIPYACAQVGVKWLGYQLGSLSGKAPLWWKKLLTSQDFYWTSNDFKKSLDL